MNWNMIISGLIIIVIKAVGMTLFLLYFPQVFGKSNDDFILTESYGTTSVQNVSQIFGGNNESVMPTRSYGTACPKDWDFHQGRCFFFSTSESTWENSKNDCIAKGSTLAIANTPEKLLLHIDYRKKITTLVVPDNSQHTIFTGLNQECEIFWDDENPTKRDMPDIKIFSAPEAKQSVLGPDVQKYLQDIANAEKYFVGLTYQPGERKWRWVNNSAFNGNVTNENQNFHCVTIGLTKTFDAASCDISYRWICERTPK